jgi:hypothetical protein
MNSVGGAAAGSGSFGNELGFAPAADFGADDGRSVNLVHIEKIIIGHTPLTTLKAGNVI